MTLFQICGEEPPHQPKRRWRSLLRVLAAMANLSLLGGCGTTVVPPNMGSHPHVEFTQQSLSELVAAIPKERVIGSVRQKALEALQLLGAGKLQAGSTQLNSALQLEPSSSYLQFFNAYAYHLMARAGDTQKYSLAAEGYKLAIRFDRSNWIAHYYLGLLHFEQRAWGAAQNEFAEVLLFREHDRSALAMMVVASYYAGDPVTADACLQRLAKIDPYDGEVMRLLAIVNAALDRKDVARRWLSQYRETRPDPNDLSATEGRLKHWEFVYREKKKLATGNEKVRDEDNGILRFDSDRFSENGAAKDQVQSGRMIQMAAAAKTEEEESKQDDQKEQAAPDGQSSGHTGQPSLPARPSSDRMVLVDVVLMYTEDTLSTSQGVNLMSMLSLQFGNGTDPAFSKVSTSTKNADGTDAYVTSLTRAISIPALTYSLNIANANTVLDEVLARPTLAALDGMKSQFFSGNTIDAAVVSTGTTSGGAVQIQKEIGVTLGITPRFLPNGKILMNVEALRTFVQPPNSNVTFTYKLEVSKISVNANVVMDFGETLVLGGLSEKETTRGRDGVPFLQDVPLVQYLFAHKSSSNYQHSVLMLITPRLPQYTYRSSISPVGAAGGAQDSNMREFRARFGDWFAPYPNMAAVFHQLNSASLYREFRTGDVNLEHWDKQDTTTERLKQALRFLFY